MPYWILSVFLKMCIITPKLAQISRKYCKYLNLCYNVPVENFYYFTNRLELNNVFDVRRRQAPRP